MFRLRQTWSDVIPQKKLYALDVQIKHLDPAWPVIAPPPPAGIHLNPKFFMQTATGIDGTLSPASSMTNQLSKLSKNSKSNSGANNTISMQQKIINKQRELLELQQKKVQLELLQTQVKLQEQLKSTHVPTNITNTRNLLLKPEVAKQLVPGAMSKGGSKSRSGTHSRNAQRINPVQGNLVNARPVRDPRLLRQLQQHPVPQSTAVQPDIHIDTKSKSEQQATESDSNKIVNNKANVRNERVEQRLVDNKGNIESHGKSKHLPYTPSLKHPQKIGSSSRITKNRFLRESRKSISPSELFEIKNSDPIDSSILKSSKSESVNKIQVFSKLKFRKKSGLHSDKDSVDKNSAVLASLEKVSDKKSDRYSKSSEKHSKSVFKDFKALTKNRAHYRRNRETTPSPEPEHDVDLRTEVHLDKIPRIQNDTINEKHESTESHTPVDTDLRQSHPTAGKKRTSADNCGSPAKKSKSEVFDALFGSEDTDLRQLPSAPESKPPTPPPPPIISEKDVEMPQQVEIKESKKDEAKDVPAKNANLDVLRAKLAKAINQDKLKESEELKASMEIKSPPKRNSRESLNNTQIIISAADEMSIKTGTMTNAQKTMLMSKILAQAETQQLREAQRRESETLSNTSFQPISDDEFDVGFSDDASDEDSQKRATRFNDRPTELPSFGNVPDDFSMYRRNMDYRDPPRGRMWRSGRHRQKHWDSGPPARVGIRQNFRPLPDPWLRPIPLPPQLNVNAFIPAPTVDIPPLVFAHPDTYNFITIDNEPREIRYYDDTAIIFLNSSDPREVSFHDGTRRIYFDNEPCLLSFNSPYEEVLIKGNVHKVRLGNPAREIIIDGNGYECYFDQKEKMIELDGNRIVVKLEPPPPQVKIGEKRLDLVAGQTQLVVDAKNMFTVFLDAKLQNFKIDGVEHTLKFVDALRAAIIDDVRHEIEFGGLPKSMMLKDRKYFIRFAVLPKGIKPGFVRIKDMEVTQTYQSPVRVMEDIVDHSVNAQAFVPGSPERTSSPGQFEMHRGDNLDMLSSVMASSMIPIEREGGSYSIEHSTPSESQQEFLQSTHTVKPETKQEPNLSLNINDLFQRLVATGIVATASPPKEPERKPSSKPVKSVKTRESAPQNYKYQDFKPPSFKKPDTLKVHRQGVIERFYVGQQCSSCGVRFPPGLDNYYKQHLDWHFRQNRKGRKSNRLSACRRWYYLCSDWKNYEEIEDLEHRGKSYFENQAGNASTELDDADIEIPCVTADPDVIDPICEVCLERLEQFYNEENEEWQLRMAIRVDDKIYHPLCYDDYQASLIDVTLNTDIHEIPGLDGVEEAPSPEPNDIDDVMEVIDNIDDEVETLTLPASTTDEHTYKILEENNLIDDDSDEADDDVIINEVVPERIVVDDDDKEDDYIPPSTIQPVAVPIIIKEEPIDDGFVDIEGGLVKVPTTTVKIKTEPVDDLDETKKDKINGDESLGKPIEVVNFELESPHSEVPSAPPPTTVAGKIKINITKPLPTVTNKEIHESINESLSPTYVDPNEPLPPGEEPVQLNIKPVLQGVQLKRNPVVKKGSELTGLCSIM